MPSPTQIALRRVPRPLRPFLVRHRKLVKFLLVGGTCFVLTLAVNYTLKLTVLSAKPVTALIIATTVATVVSYVLNRQWSFRSNGAHRREFFLFLLVSGLAILVNAVPQMVAEYVLGLRSPHVSRANQEISDFLSGIIVGTLLATGFRWWAMKRWVFVHRPDLAPPSPDARAQEPVA